MYLPEVAELVEFVWAKRPELSKHGAFCHPAAAWLLFEAYSKCTPHLNWWRLCLHGAQNKIQLSLKGPRQGSSYNGDWTTESYPHKVTNTIRAGPFHNCEKTITYLWRSSSRSKAHRSLRCGHVIDILHIRRRSFILVYGKEGEDSKQNTNYILIS